MDLYSAAKDFAGPLATVLAASAALWVTYNFNKRQVAIASSQRDIALDKLKHDVFQKRYEVYTTARELLVYVVQLHDFEKIDSSKIRELRVKIDEARFFFGPSVRSFLNDMDREAESLLENLGRRYGYEAETDEELWRSIGSDLAENAKKLGEYHRQMPARFEQAMRITQLARD